MLSFVRPSGCALAALVVLSGCSQSAPADRSSESDASAPIDAAASLQPASGGGSIRRNVGESKPEHPALARARTIVHGDAILTGVLADAPSGLSLAREGFVSDGFRNASVHALDKIGAVLPQRANDPVRLSPSRAERWTISLEPKGFGGVAGVLDGGRVVYENALPHADMIAVAHEREAEMFLLLHDAEAPTKFHWKLTVGSGLKSRTLSTGAIDFLDEHGEAALRVQPAYAIDATGKRVDVPLKLAGDDLSLEVDTTGLAFPVLVDPVVEVPVWQQVATTGLPTDSDYNTMAWSSSLGKSVLIGGKTYDGIGCSGSATYLSPLTWSWNGTAWSSIAGGPSARFNMASTSYGTDIVVVGGVNCPGGATTLLGDTWRLTGSTWSSICASGSCGIPNQQGAAMAYLASYGILLVSGPDGLTYRFNGGTTWTNIPAGTAEGANGWIPPARIDAAMSADPVTGKFILVGGYDPTDGTRLPYADAWEFNPAGDGLTFSTPRWFPICGQKSDKGCPFAPRSGASLVYDATRKRHVLVGGRGGGGNGVLNDTWEFVSKAGMKAGGTWTSLCDSCAPSRRDASAAFDTTRRRVVMAAGQATGRQQDTWEYRVRGGSCSTNADCDTFNCIEGTCCETVCPTCQTCADPTSPGVCTNVAAGISDPLARCTSGGQCNGGGACRSPLGTACAAGTECATGFCVNATCCATSSCGSGLTCANASGTCKKVLGQSCLTGGECASANCVDGVCCSSATCGSTAKCDYAGSLGTCKSNNGQTCTAGTQCGSGNCVDGVCCNTSCTSQCQACDVAGNVGTCIPVTGAVHPSSGLRTACAGTGPCASTCNGSATTCQYPGTTSACGTASCATGVQTNVGQCNGAGSCTQSTTPCGNYACGTGVCKTSCATAADCASTSYYCAGGACQLKVANGSTCATAASCQSGNCVSGICCDTACTTSGFSCNLPTAPGKCVKANATACSTSSECGSGFCVDGVCCDSACNGQCQACDVSGQVGKCSAVAGTPHGTRPGCGGTGSGTTCGARCDGTNLTACVYPTSTTTCGAATCTNGTTTSTYSQVGFCNSAGSCTAGSGDCGTYKCSGTACRNSCTALSDCQAGNYCKAGFCVPIEGLGAACTDASACPSGYCTDGVCCATGPCGTGASCNATTLTKGTCRKFSGTTCVSNGECASGNCADGYCCNSSCTGSCEACNVSGSEGTCTPIVGQPLIGHPACSGTPTDPQCGLRCDGTDAKACKFAAATVACGTASCASFIESRVSSCDGSGSCKSSTRSCGTYGCGPTACLASCATDANCSPGNFCKAGACVSEQLLGESCSGNSQCKSGNCTDGVCCEVADCGAGAACAGPGEKAGKCLKSLGSTCTGASDCASGRCVDGLCCDKACDGQCEACDVSGSEGTCTPVTGKPHLPRAACDSLGDDDCAKATCDGATRDKCGGFKNGATTSCGVDTCTMDRKLQKKGRCDGKGACANPDPISCLEYACDTTASACRTSCTTDADCSTDYKCDAASGKCVQGSTCTEDKKSSVDKTGVVSLCAPYMCGPEGTCLKQCATSTDCAPGLSCDPASKACMGTVVEGGGDSGGCTTSGHGTTRGGWSMIVAAAAVAEALRRRRHRAAK